MNEFLSSPITIPGTSAGHTILFLVYLAVGWFTIILHAHANFERATYDIEKDDPASLMIPRFLASENLYLRGFAIYLAGMTMIYVIFSLVGPDVVDPKAALNAADPQHSKAALEPDHWPLILSVAMVGLAPSIPWIREPELLLRRFSQRVAFIPAYARELADQMERAPFTNPADAKLRFPAGIRYRPPLSDDPIDHLWLKLCVVGVRIKCMSDDRTVPESGHQMDDNKRILLQKEAQLFYSSLREIDGKLTDGALTEEKQNEVETEIHGLLRRAFLFLACGLIAYRVRNISRVLETMGFGRVGVDTPAVLPFLMVFSLLFAWLMVADDLVVPAFGLSGEAPNFIARCKGIGLIVLILGLSLFAGFIAYRRLDVRGSWAGKTISARGITAYFLVSLSAFAFSGCFSLINQYINGFASQDLANWLAFSFYHSVPLATAALLFAVAQQRVSTSWFAIGTYGAITTLLVAVSWGAATLLYLQAIGGFGPGYLYVVTYDTLQGVAIGLAVALLSELMRSYRASASEAPVIAAEVVA